MGVFGVVIVLSGFGFVCEGKSFVGDITDRFWRACASWGAKRGENQGLFWLAAALGVLSLGRGQNLRFVVSCSLSVVSCGKGPRGRASRLAWLFVQLIPGLIVSELAAIFYIVVERLVDGCIDP